MNGNSHNSPKISVVLGSQWGDEGKGKLVDLLAQKADVVARCQGGNNAGHTVVTEEGKFAFHLLPSGLINPQVKAVLGNGVVINVPEFLKEIEENEAKGMAKVTAERLRISDRAHIVFPMHMKADGYQEEQRKNKNEMLGTTKKGIGPCYASKIYRSGLKIADLVAEDFDTRFADKYRRLAADHNRAFDIDISNVEEEISNYKVLSEIIKPYVEETVSYMHASMNSGAKILVEGANASMLDIDFGTYPYVTSSNCTIGGVYTGLGLPNRSVNKVFGVVKAYTTRVGAGAFPTELANELGDYLQKTGAEFGVTTGRKRRCGWLDLPMLKYTNMLNGYTAIALTKVDILDDLDEVKIGVNYVKNGEIMKHYPSSEQDYVGVTIEYLTMPGWKTDISKCRNFEDLPPNAQNYVLKIEEILGVPIWWIGVGQARLAMVDRVPSNVTLF